MLPTRPEAIAPGDQAPPSVSAVIATRGRGHALAGCLRPLLADPGLLEVVLVFDDDEDAATVATAAFTDPRVRVIEVQGQNKAAARQAGASAARGDILLLLDDDVILDQGVVSGHARRHDGPGKVVVGYMPVPPSRQAGISRFPTRSYADSYESNRAAWEYDPELILHKLWGGNVSMWREDALRVGLHNPALAGCYHEDWDLGLRCHAAGLVGLFDRTLSANHEHQRSVRRWVTELQLHGISHEELGIAAPSRRSDVLAPVSVPVLVGCLYVISALRLRWLESPVAWRLKRLQARRGAQAERDRRARVSTEAFQQSTSPSHQQAR